MDTAYLFIRWTGAKFKEGLCLMGMFFAWFGMALLTALFGAMCGTFIGMTGGVVAFPGLPVFPPGDGSAEAVGFLVQCVCCFLAVGGFFFGLIMCWSEFQMWERIKRFFSLQIRTKDNWIKPLYPTSVTSSSLGVKRVHEHV